ncbi:ATP/maltotriose-dependent transcriptional regulator MalT [Catenuloplanes nepalensis]|uniref:ATP/maltotriose-dependent transcriptional regulator MalT n=1 Tax=Catenuloplanes nepalensis TaxID=587533 RepID=A0ABT9MU03_9ACTN|nr:AAA family ATPase [Catenuloplanes nepalensis]MDP9794880.1 ATP/maltotriose-dependent transcriptional regulator MalT [Catenuloplanes nepalensis]
MTQRLDFVGRSAETEILRRAWQSARDGGGARLAAVHGPAGIGKTALVRQVLATTDGAPTIIRVSADRAGFVQPWAVLGAILREFAAHGETAGPPAETADPFLVATTVAGLLTRAGGLILFLDDAHRIDVPSLTALRHAAGRVTRHPLLILLAYQAGTDPAWRLTGPDADPDRPQTWVDEFDPARTDEITLGGLSVEDLMRVAHARERPLPTAAAVRLHEITGGHPVHAAHLIDRYDPATLTAAIGPLDAPPDVARAVAAGLADLPPDVRDVIMTAAVLGRRFSVADLRELSGTDVRAALATGIEAGLLDEEPGSAGRRLRFVTTLVRDAAYARLPADRRGALHRAAARLGDRDTVWHRVAASDGPDENLAEAVARVAGVALREGRPQRAAQFLTQALELTPRDSPHRAARLLEAVELLLVSGEIATAVRYLDALDELPATPWRAYVRSYLLMISGDLAAVRSGFQTALAEMDDEAPADLEARICGQIAILGIVELRHDETVSYADRALALHPRDPSVLTFAWFARSVGLAMTGRGPEALAALASSTALVRASGLDALVARGMIHLWTDDLDAARRDLTDAVQRATRGESLRIGQALAYLAETEFRRGDLDAAVHLAQWAADDAEANGRFWDFALVRALRAYPHAARGDWRIAEELVRSSGNTAVTRIGRAYFAGGLAALAQARDDPGALLTAADDLAAVLDVGEPGTHLYGPLRADALSRLGRLDEATAELAAFRARYDHLGRTSALMAADRVEAQIALAAGRPERARDLIFDALRAAERVGLPIEAGRIRVVAARILDVLGRRRAAERFLGRALYAFRGAGAYEAQARALAAAVNLPVGRPAGHGLGAHERRAIRLHLDGATHAAIGAAMHYKPKSIENMMRAIRHVKLEIQPVEDVDAVLAEAIAEGVADADRGDVPGRRHR